MYRDNCFVRTGTYTAEFKVWIRNTWDWIEVQLRKSDEENVKLQDKPINQQIILGVDLGINNACACSAMLSDGTVIDRKILKLTREKDSLNHKLNKIKKAQQHGAKKMPRLWARAKGVNLDITHKTAQFIADVATLYSADVIVFEHLDTQGKKHGSKKQRLHHWWAQAVQRIVADKAHRNGVHIRRVCA